MLTFERAATFADAETLYRDTLAKNPGAWAARNDLGVILAATNLPAAIEQFTASLKSNPDNPDAHANLAQALALQGKSDQAEPEFRKALALKPLDAQVHRNFAVTLGQSGKQPEAVSHLQTALSIKPDLPTQLELAQMFFQASDLREAETQYRQALRLDPDCLEALNNLGWLLATASDDKLRDGAEAVHLAERAQRLPPAKGMCVAGTLAAAYAEAGRFSEAVATAEKAVRDETAAGETRFADLNRQLLTVYRAGKPWHGTIAKNPNRFGVGDNSP
jgi:Tfp pilus assembly protein PilF